MAMHGNCSSPVMAATVQQTWQPLLPRHGNQHLLASKLGFYSHGSYSPTYMATTVRHCNQYLLASKLVFQVGAHQANAINHECCTHSYSNWQIPKTIYDSFAHDHLVAFFVCFFHHHLTNLLFFTCYSPQKQMQYCFLFSLFFYLVVPHVPILCGLPFQFDVLYLQQSFPATVKLAMRCLPMWFHRNNLRSWQQLVIAWQLQFVQHGTCSGPTMPYRFVHTCHPRLFRHCSHV